MGEKPPGKGGTTVVKVLLRKLRESLISVFPVALIVFVLSLTPLVSLSPREMTVFLLSAAVMVAGIGLFGLGADMAMSPMGEQIGSGLARSRNLPLLLSAAFVMGLCITVAEPDLSVLASQVREVVSDKLLIFSVGCGVGIFLLLSVLRMIFRVNLSNLLFYSYLALFMLTTLVLVYGDADYLALAFDAGGVTTGPVTVPFLLALGVGIAGTLGGKHASENSFGMIALSSVGPMIVVAALGIGAKGGFNYTLPDYSMESKLGAGILRVLLSTGRDVGIAVVLIVLFFTILDRVFLRLPKKTLIRIAVGIAYTFAGLVLFLSAATVGFMPIGFALGRGMADTPALLLGFSFLLGAVVVLAEPAVLVLNRQVEGVTGGTVDKRSVMIALSCGVGLSIGLSMLRIWLGFSILCYLIPGYLLSLGLSFFVPKLYTAIAFDSGGVASGPLTSTFILPFAIGACTVLQGEGKILSDAFGIVAMVAMTPLITIQLLGFRAIMAGKIRDRSSMRRILGADDEEIIRFM